jgi:hypothetical protein
MNQTVNLFLLLILGSSLIFPAAAIKYAQAEGATVITSQSNTKTFKCIDPTGKKLLCILVVTNVKPPKDTLTCKDPDNHKFKCSYIIINKKYTNNVFRKIVFLYVYVTPKDRKLLYENKTNIVPIFVTKIVVKIIHEHEPSGNVRVVVIREQEDNYRPTVVVTNCFAPCFQQEYSRALIQNTIFNSPVFITNFNQITTIVKNINTINSVNMIRNNIINNAYLNNVNTDNMNTFNPPPAPAYSPTSLFSLPPDTPIYKGGTTNPTIGSASITKVIPKVPGNITTNTPSFNNSTSTRPSNNMTSSVPSSRENNTASTQNNTIIPPPPPSASSVPSSKSNVTSTPSTPSKQQPMTQGCGEGTDNSTCQLNQKPTPTPAPGQNTTPTTQQNINNSSNQDLTGGSSNNTNGASSSTGNRSNYSDDHHHH